jgi:hypothetical protein
VYIAAFAPDKGESVNTLIADPPPGAPVPPILPPDDGFLFLDRDKFAGSFAANLPPDEAAFIADSQVPWGLDALNGAVSEPAWRTKPSWYLIATDDHMIPPTRNEPCANASAQLPSRSQRATPSTCRNPTPSPLSSPTPSRPSRRPAGKANRHAVQPQPVWPSPPPYRRAETTLRSAGPFPAGKWVRRG